MENFLHFFNFYSFSFRIKDASNNIPNSQSFDIDDKNILNFRDSSNIHNLYLIQVEWPWG